MLPAEASALALVCALARIVLWPFTTHSPRNKRSKFHSSYEFGCAIAVKNALEYTALHPSQRAKHDRQSRAMMTSIPPLTTTTIWAILDETLDDATVNQLVWHGLGYRYDATSDRWDTTAVSPDWQEAYPEPPDFIEHRPPNVKLTRSIPAENKQLLKEKLGFQGYKVGELIPRKTRRATIANWLLSYMQQTGLDSYEDSN